MRSLASSLEKKIKKYFWSLAGSRVKPGKPAPLHRSGPGSLLVLRPDRLGDFILSVPALRAVESRLNRGSRLTLVAGDRNAELARLLFPGARVLVFRKSFFPRILLFARLWLGRFDAAIDFHSYPFSTTSALMTLLSGSPWRIGFWDPAEPRGLSRKIFNGGVRPPRESVHETRKSLLLARRLFPRIPLSAGDFPMPPVPVPAREGVDVFFAGLGLGPRDKVIGIHPTLQKEDNRWRPENYLELVRKSERLPRVKWIVVYGRGEEGLLKSWLEALGPSSRVFPLPGSEILFILESLKRMDGFVGGDSGLTHLAALATRVVALYGPSDPRRWGPRNHGLGQPKILRGKDGSCDSVSVEEVLGEIKKIFAAKARRNRVGRF